MSVDVEKLRTLLARKEGRHWYPRNRFISLVPDNSGMGATLPTNHVANFVDKETCELAAEAVNALPQLLAEVETHRKVAAELNAFIAQRDQLLAIAEAAMAYVDAERTKNGYSTTQYHALLAAVDAARKAGT